jgi:hypothetical protein
MTMTSTEKTYENLIRRAADRQGYLLVKSRRRDPTSLTYGRYLLVPKSEPRPRNVAEAEAALATEGLTLAEIEEKIKAEASRNLATRATHQRPGQRQPRTEMTAGDRYGHWTLLSTETTPEDGYATMLCRCDCGTQRRVRSQNLRRGQTVSCGECEYSAHAPVTEPKVGETFEWWTVIGEPNDGQALCSCRCGRVRRVSTRRLRSGDTKSCGCRAKWRTGPPLTGPFAPTAFDRTES